MTQRLLQCNGRSWKKVFLASESAFGPALTSWVLFVVYIGLVGAAWPVQQGALLKKLARSQNNRSQSVQPLPDFCTSRLPRLPQTWVRVSLGGRIILLDSRQRIADMVWLE